jgi:Tol biopolymer transport system component
MLTLVGLAAFVIWRWTPEERGSLATANRLVSNFPGSSGAASFSPDGTMIAFQNDASGKSQIYVKTLAQGEPLQITADEEAAERPVWSPKGDQILFQHRGGIWSVPPLGGPPRQIIAQGMNPNFALSGDEFVYEGPDPSGDDAIWIADVTGGHRRRVTQRPSPFPSDPALSPDGEFTAFFQSVDGPLVDLWVIPSAGGTPRRLTFDTAEAGRPIWTPDGRSIIFSSSRGGSQTLWRIPASGGTPDPVTAGAGQDRDPAISADGRHLVYTNVRQSTALLIKYPSTGEQKEVLERRASLFGPTFSPAGDRIAFSQQVGATVGAAAHLFTISVNGKDLRQITHAPDEQNLFPQWPGDETFLYFTRGRPGASFRKIPTRGGESAEVGQWVWQNWPRVDPFGRSVAYTRYEGGRDEAVVRSLGSQREIVMDLAINWIRWARDGQTITGTQTVRIGERNSWNVVSCAVRDGKCRVLTRGHDPVPSRDGTRIFFLRPSTGGFYDVWVMNSDGSNPHSLGVLGPFSPADVSFDVSPQDQIVFAQLREGTSELWRAELR